MLQRTSLELPKKSILRIGVHDGFFHCDDIMALSLIKVYYDEVYDIQIIRTRDRELLMGCNLLVDVGGEYDGERLFDHHQDNNLKCAVSLVWTAIGGQFEFEYEYMNKTILDGISDLDVDYQRAIENRGDPGLYYNINSMIWDMNYLSDGFDRALRIGMDVWTANLAKMKAIKKERGVIRDGKKIGNILVLNEGIDIKSHLDDLNEMEIIYVAHPHYNPSKWCLKTINSKEWPLPELKYVEYVHSAKFLAIFSSWVNLEANFKLLNP